VLDTTCSVLSGEAQLSERAPEAMPFGLGHELGSPVARDDLVEVGVRVHHWCTSTGDRGIVFSWVRFGRDRPWCPW
jgi:hypothetical protein